MKRNLIGLLLFGLMLGLSLPVVAQETNKVAQGDSSRVVRVPAGQKQSIRGIIVKREADGFIMRDLSGGDIKVNLSNATKVEEKKGNPFRRARNYGATSLLRGLSVEVTGRGDGSGALLAEKVQMRDYELVAAQTTNALVVPVEGRVGEAENRLSQAESNAQRLSGQLEELAAVANTARGGAKAAQETADMAVAGVESTNKRIDTIVSSLDDYEAKNGITVNFRAGSFRLSPDAMASLDEIASQAKTERAYVIEITGYASAEGAKELNKRLSQQRADAVVRYLADNHMIPLRRIITPHGYGTLNPVADNTTRDGRKENRRVEVKILVNKGMTSPAAPVQMNKPNSTGDGQ
ncbi:MAG TPA: OmpA family protein [Blastocatellia bacterium]|nr:OmpA family protein [Blastocatellia bacterium]